MKPEVYYHVVTVFGTVVSVSLDDFLDTLKNAKFRHLPYSIKVDKSYSFAYYVTLFG